ncbi:MAG: hypothetical protein ACYC4S_17140 [Rhodoferax sp.]
MAEFHGSACFSRNAITSFGRVADSQFFQKPAPNSPAYTIIYIAVCAYSTRARARFSQNCPSLAELAAAQRQRHDTGFLPLTAGLCRLADSVSVKTLSVFARFAGINKA